MKPTYLYISAYEDKEETDFRIAINPEDNTASISLSSTECFMEMNPTFANLRELRDWLNENLTDAE